MTTPNILTDTTPVPDSDRPGLVHSVITDAWGLYFAQGGVVMAAALRAMEAVLDRPDLRLASTSATFCRPVACGPVTTTVDVLRNGRRGAQVSGLLRDPTDDAAGANVVVSAVFTDPTLPGPTITALPRPADLRAAPEPDLVPLPIEGDYPLGFLDNTEWQTATDPAAELAADPDAVPRLGLWFRFSDPPAPAGTDWDPALLPIPGDALGSALVVALGEGEHPVGSVSLQIDVQVHAPVSGTWIGIDSTCTRVGGGLATGIAYLWSDTGNHVATVTQTAMLRSFPT
jgi:acyl-CoA thioesterase